MINHKNRSCKTSMPITKVGVHNSGRMRNKTRLTFKWGISRGEWIEMGANKLDHLRGWMGNLREAAKMAHLHSTANAHLLSFRRCEIPKSPTIFITVPTKTGHSPCNYRTSEAKMAPTIFSKARKVCPWSNLQGLLRSFRTKSYSRSTRLVRKTRAPRRLV